MLRLEAERASLPFFPDFVEHRGNHPDQDIDRPAIGGEGVFDNPAGGPEILVPSGIEQRVEDLTQKVRPRDLVARTGPSAPPLRSCTVRA